MEMFVLLLNIMQVDPFKEVFMGLFGWLVGFWHFSSQ
jgi:hypothetical protein